jgi:alanine racemase
VIPLLPFPMPGAATRAAFVDLIALRENADEFVGLSGAASASVNVSADAYGHGAAEIVRVCSAAGISTRTTAADEDTPIDLYGLLAESRFRPVMRVSALVVGTKTIEAGEGVSYGYTYRAARRTNLALVGIGYADGLDRRASNVASLRLGGRDRTIAGRVAMNALVLDLGDDTVAVGDEAIVFGDPQRGEPTVEGWADSIGISARQATTVFGSHLPRVFT